MARGRMESEWWQTSYVVAALRNLMQTDKDKLVTPIECNPMVPESHRKRRDVVLTGDALKVAFQAMSKRKA